MRYLLITLLAFMLMGSSIEDAREANEAYNNGEYEKAISLYKKAIDEDPRNAKLVFNLANAQAKAGNNEQAIRTFEQYKSMTDDPEQRARADYNIGNILSEDEQWDEAVERYKQSLRFMNNDPDAKYNYEFARQQKQQEQEQDQQNQQQQNQDQQNQQNQQDQQNQQQQQNQQDQQEQQNQQQQQQQSKMSQAEAEKILEALGQREKELLKQFKKQKSESDSNTNEKDW